MLAHVLKRVWEKREARRISVMQLFGEAGGVFMGAFIYVFSQKPTLTLHHNALTVPTHDRADQKLKCAKTQPLNIRQMKFPHNLQLHQSCVNCVVKHTRQQAT